VNLDDVRGTALGHKAALKPPYPKSVQMWARIMPYRYLGRSVIAILIAGIAPLSAHHSSAPHFDRDTSIELDAFVTDVKFVNPHAYVYFDVSAEPKRCLG
jgi:hypothetical protein